MSTETAEQIDIGLGKRKVAGQAPEPVENEEVASEEPRNKIVRVLDDTIDIMQLVAAINPERTVQVPLLSQGLMLTSNVVKMTEINEVATSENYRLKLIELIFKKLTADSKALFDNSYVVFKESVSYYDLDIFLEKQIASWGDDKFSGVCTNSSCENEIEFEKPLSDMLKVSEEITQRMESIKMGESLEILNLPSPNVIIDETITARLGLPTLEKYEYLSKMRLPDLMFVKLLHIEALIILTPSGETVELPMLKSTAKDFVTVLDTRNITVLNAAIETNFKFLDIKYEVRVGCDKCSHVNTFNRTDLTESLLGKILS